MLKDYARLEADNRLVYFNGRLGNTILPLNSEKEEHIKLLLENDYRLVVPMPMPEYVAGRHYTAQWEKTDTQLIQSWTYEDYPDEARQAKRLEISTFVSGKTTEKVKETFGVEIPFDVPFSPNNLLNVLFKTKMSINDIMAKGVELFGYFADKGKALLDKVVDLETVDEINAFNVEEEYNKLNVAVESN